MTKFNPNKPLDEPLWDLPLDVMDIGESFFIPTMKPAYMSYVVDCAAKRLEVKVKTYTTTKDGMIGVRVWRTS